MRENIESDLEGFSWFTHCGEQIYLGFEYHQVGSINEAILKSQEVSWENKVLDTREDFRFYIKDKDSENYKNWNNIAEEARMFIEQKLHPIWTLYAKNNNLGKEFIESMDWDVINLILVSKFYRYTENLEFFENLLKIYESGKFLCGWESENNGYFFVY